MLAEPAPPELQSEEKIGQVAKEARVPVMTGDQDDIDDLAGVQACACVLRISVSLVAVLVRRHSTKYSWLWDLYHADEVMDQDEMEDLLDDLGIDADF